MYDDLISEGECIYCKEMVLREKMAGHLKKHLSKSENPGSNSPVYHLNIGVGKMFLHLLIDGNSALKVLDTYLRNIWLECCGHMSEFFEKRNEIPVKTKIMNAFIRKEKYIYKYDYGSTTTLDIKVAGIYNIEIDKKIKLLSRNEPLKILCSICKEKPASSVCFIHSEEYDEGCFCSECIPKHEKECEDFIDYSNMQIVNSPRMGVCGYSGGKIDKERDGIYKLK